jgi:hypothetical protein
MFTTNTLAPSGIRKEQKIIQLQHLTFPTLSPEMLAATGGMLRGQSLKEYEGKSLLLSIVMLAPLRLRLPLAESGHAALLLGLHSTTRPS